MLSGCGSCGQGRGVNAVREPDYDLIEEERMRKAEESRQRARSAAIHRDPYYPPEWAAAEFDGELEDDA